VRTKNKTSLVLECWLDEEGWDVFLGCWCCVFFGRASRARRPVTSVRSWIFVFFGLPSRVRPGSRLLFLSRQEKL